MALINKIYSGLGDKLFALISTINFIDKCHLVTKNALFLTTSKYFKTQSSTRNFTKLDAEKVPIYVINAWQASRCWNCSDAKIETCWKLPKLDSHGNFLRRLYKEESSSSSAALNSCSFSSSFSNCTFDSPPKYIFIEEAKKLVERLKMLKNKTPFF